MGECHHKPVNAGSANGDANEILCVKCAISFIEKPSANIDLANHIQHLEKRLAEVEADNNRLKSKLRKIGVATKSGLKRKKKA